MSDSQQEHTTAEGPAPGARRSTGGMQGERRIVTALFCDVVGSTSMAEQLDPEEWAEIMNEAFGLLTEPVTRYEGNVARLMGDAILAFFGAPVAHEDDPQRAILAGLDIVEGIGPFREQIKREYGLDFNVRVGINTGPVVAGDVGSAQGGEYTAMGDAVNLAARMEQTAQPGTVQVAGDTYKLVAPLFDFEPLGEIEVKGASDAVPAYRAIGPKAQPGRLRGIEGLNAPLIGRQDEIETLQGLARDVRQGRGQIVSLVGEAGLGKSRLVEELRGEWERESSNGAVWVESRGIAYDMSRPYALFIQQLRQVCGIEENDSPDVVRQKIQDIDGASPERVALLTRAADVLLLGDADHEGPQLQAEAVKRELFDTLLALWREMAASGPAVIVMDDLHWTDPASVELLLHLMQLAEDTPVFFLCAFRPERRSPAWRVKQTAETDYPHLYTEITLNPLTEEHSDALISSLLTISDLPSSLRRMILQKAEGNPFFVEEVVRTLIDGGAVVRDESGMHWRAATKVDDIAIPDNLQSLLIARFDRLEEEARKTLQLASVIGRSFYYKVLEIVSDASVTLDRQLNTLQRVELIREAARLPELEYMFKHELTREAAYGSILRRRRRTFHRQVGEAIEGLFSDRLEEEAHRLAHHFDESKDAQRALKYYTMAGDAAARLYANTEAIDHYTRALGLATRGEATDEQLIHLYTIRGRTMELASQHDDALANYGELEAIAQERKNPALEVAALLPQATLHSTFTSRFDPDRGEDLAVRALALAKELQDPQAEAKALWNLMLAMTFGRSDPSAAVDYGEQSIAIARENSLREELAFALNDISRVYFSIGQTDQAAEAGQEARELWRALGNLPMLGDNLMSESLALYAAGDLDGAKSASEEALQAARSIGNLWGEAGALLLVGPFYLERGEIDSGIETVEQAISMSEQANFAGPSVLIRTVLAWTYAMLGDIDRAFEQAQTAADSLGESTDVTRFTMACLGYLHMVNGDSEKAQEAIKNAYGGVPKDDAGERVQNLGPFSLFFDLLEVEVLQGVGDHDKVLAATERAMSLMEDRGMKTYLPDLLRVRSRTLLSLGKRDEARQALSEARELAEQQVSRRSLWQVLHDLHDLESEEGNSEAAESLREQARVVIHYIADHIAAPELRASFMDRPEVRAMTQ